MPPKAAKHELHFFPGAKLLFWIVGGKALLRTEAWGGEPPVPGMKYETMKPRKTTPGRYVVYSYAPYRTTTWAWSAITWGTHLRLDDSGSHVLYETGMQVNPWARVESKVPNATPDLIRTYHNILYGEERVPDTWVFNDFGAFAVRYFKDSNHDHKLDNGETLSGEMIHTTPPNEAQTSRGLTVQFESSHGCIHMSPSDRDRFHAAGAFRKGTDFVIHRYDESLPKGLR